MFLSDIRRQKQDRQQQPSVSGHRSPYITSQGTHFLNVAHLGSVIGSGSVERGLGLSLQAQ